MLLSNTKPLPHHSIEAVSADRGNKKELPLGARGPQPDWAARLYSLRFDLDIISTKFVPLLTGDRPMGACECTQRGDRTWLDLWDIRKFVMAGNTERRV